MAHLRGLIGAVLGLALVLGASSSGALAQQTKSTWDTIKERGSIRVGVLQGEPYGYKDPASNEWSGMNVSLGKAVAKALNVKLELVEVTWGTAVPGLQSNKIDIMPFLNATPERAVVVDYANAALSYDPLAVLAREGLNAANWTDLDRADVTIAVVQGSSQDAFISAAAPKAKILRFPNYADQAAAFQGKTADVLVLYQSTVIPVHKRLGRGQVVVPKPARYDAADIALRREPDRTLKDWLSLAGTYYYNTNQTQLWYEEAMRSRGYDPGAGIRRELW